MNVIFPEFQSQNYATTSLWLKDYYNTNSFASWIGPILWKASISTKAPVFNTLNYTRRFTVFKYKASEIPLDIR